MLDWSEGGSTGWNKKEKKGVKETLCIYMCLLLLLHKFLDVYFAAVIWAGGAAAAYQKRD